MYNSTFCIFRFIITNKKKTNLKKDILSIRQPFLKFKETELKLFGNYKVPSRIVTDFSKAMMQTVLQEYLGENIAQYLSRMLRITKGIIPDEENKTTRLHVFSFHF